MAIDYSKWDKIELSDDSDVEVHPNVDKRSFIKWKQESIRETRAKRNQDINNLETQVSMYTALNKRVDKLLSQSDDNMLTDISNIAKFLNVNFDKTEKQKGENVDPNIPSYNEMVEDLFEQLYGDAKKEGEDSKNGLIIKELCLRHRAKIDKVTIEATSKLQELYKEKNAHISSDDIHTGFDSSFLNKANEKDGKTSQQLSSISEAQSNTNLEKLPILRPKLEFIDYGEDMMKLAPETEKFGELPVGNYKMSEKFLLDHMPILSEQQKDALMMKAFEYQMDGNETTAYRVIHQSELLAYVREVYELKKIPFLNIDQMEETIKMFFQRVIYNNSNPMGKQSFLSSVQNKFEHVKNRVKVLEQEQGEDGEGVETIQLKSLDDSTELEINLPDFNSINPEEVERVNIFNKLPKKMQDALKTHSLDNINEVFSDTPIEEAEAYLELFNEAGIIGVKALLENEEEFQTLQDEYNLQTQSQMENLSLEKETKELENINSADIVD